LSLLFSKLLKLKIIVDLISKFTIGFLQHEQAAQVLQRTSEVFIDGWFTDGSN
jgi:hypothetical protein